jgi:germination protein YpeB
MRKNIILGVFAIAVVILGIWTYSANAEKIGYKNLLTGAYEDSYMTLEDALTNMDNSLSKALVATDDSYLRATLLDVWRYSIQGAQAVTNLPVSHVAVQQTSEILNQAGDYCYYAAQKIDGKNNLSDEEISNLNKIKDSVYTIRKNVEALSEKIRSGDVSIFRTDNNKSFYYDGESDYATDTAFLAIDKTSMEYPKLIYDGPFSEGLKENGPKADLGAEVDESKAKEAAEKFLGNNVQLNKTQDDNGIIPCYVFETSSSNNGETYYRVKVSKAGGHVLQIISNRTVNSQTLDIAAAQEKAKQFLEANGFSGMSENYYETYSNKTVFNFVAQKDSVIIYPDMVKVQVALDNGEIVGFEASTYYMCHYDRTISRAKISMQQAQKSISANLTVISQKLAIIPLDNGSEVMCYEFKGKTKDNEIYIVYINADTGAQQEILKVIEANNSILTL